VLVEEHNDKKEMVKSIPPFVFQMFSVINCVFYVVAIVSYWMRRNSFPIKQRYPKVVLVNSSLMATLGIRVLLMFAVVDNAFLLNCSIASIVLSILEGVSVVITACRIAFICLKDIFTKVIMHNEDLTRSRIADDFVRAKSKKNPLFKFTVCLLSKAQGKLSTLELAIIFVFPAIVISIVDISTTIAHGYSPDLLINSPDCQALLRTNGFLKSAFYVYFVFLSLIAVFTLVHMNDNFSMGKEIRGLLVLALVMAIMTNATLNFELFSVIVVQTHVWNFVVGVLIIPSSFALQLVFPVYLSKLHARKLKISRQEQLESSKDPACLEKTPREELLEILASQEGRCAFLLYLESEFSVENLFFIEACSDFKMRFSLEKPEDVRKAAVKIVEMFILTSSAHCVNISFPARRKLLVMLQSWKDIKAPNIPSSLETFRGSQSSLPLVELSSAEDLTPEIFESAKEEIVSMLANDTLLRFKSTQGYKNLISETKGQSRKPVHHLEGLEK
jgi:hypothetical protein